MLPNGIIGHLFGPFEGRWNDNFLLTESGLLDQLAQFAFLENLDENAPQEECTFQIFGGPAYGVGPHIMSPFSGVGWHNADGVANTWWFLNAKWKMWLYSSPVGRYHWIGVLLTNSLNCLQPNQVAQYFDCLPLGLEEYLHH
ncbi:hypothetical protein J132_08815 [Termitomyces sp. J132]|nr:hypothetical protein J132_08815 [Termitomyces sp. J132]